MIFKFLKNGTGGDDGNSFIIRGTFKYTFSRGTSDWRINDSIILQRGYEYLVGSTAFLYGNSFAGERYAESIKAWRGNC